MSCDSLSITQAIAVDRCALNARGSSGGGLYDHNTASDRRNSAIRDYRAANPRLPTETESENRARRLFLDRAVLQQCCGLRANLPPTSRNLGVYATVPRAPVEIVTTPFGLCLEVPVDSRSVSQQALDALAEFRPDHPPLLQVLSGHHHHRHELLGCHTPACQAVAQLYPAFARVRLTVRVHPKSDEVPETDGLLVSVDLPQNGLSWMARTPVDLVRYLLRRAPDWFGLSATEWAWVRHAAKWSRSAWGEWEPNVSLVSDCLDRCLSPEWLATLRDRYRQAWEQGRIHQLYGVGDQPLVVVAPPPSPPVPGMVVGWWEEEDEPEPPELWVEDTTPLLQPTATQDDPTTPPDSKKNRRGRPKGALNRKPSAKRLRLEQRLLSPSEVPTEGHPPESEPEPETPAPEPTPEAPAPVTPESPREVVVEPPVLSSSVTKKCKGSPLPRCASKSQKPKTPKPPK